MVFFSLRNYKDDARSNKHKISKDVHIYIYIYIDYFLSSCFEALNTQIHSVYPWVLDKRDKEFNWHRGSVTKKMYLYILLVGVYGPELDVCVLMKLTIRIPSRMSQKCLETDHEHYIFNNMTSLG